MQSAIRYSSARNSWRQDGPRQRHTYAAAPWRRMAAVARLRRLLVTRSCTSTRGGLRRRPTVGWRTQSRPGRRISVSASGSHDGADSSRCVGLEQALHRAMAGSRRRAARLPRTGPARYQPQWGGAGRRYREVVDLVEHSRKSSGRAVALSEVVRPLFSLRHRVVRWCRQDGRAWAESGFHAMPSSRSREDRPRACPAKSVHSSFHKQLWADSLPRCAQALCCASNSSGGAARVDQIARSSSWWLAVDTAQFTGSAAGRKRCCRAACCGSASAYRMQPVGARVPATGRRQVNEKRIHAP